MKITTLYILLLLLLFSTCCFSQQRKIYILHSRESKLTENDRIINFYFDNQKLLFGYIKKQYRSQRVNYRDVQTHIVNIDKLKKLIALKIKEIGVEKYYTETYFDIKVFVPNSDCKNLGTLYDVNEFVYIRPE
ncbi:hypothetical protein GV828_09170 [Flavobacterium sp. NST-5]|uniref:POTRA domain-containing protein n=1 Tax=Flavobacterium ichthyis TaxID=2698827 RepID=A0ABW9ZB65_9FLAO|nr:hypothetical protein [Flavobacterium ichthyis]NBL65366.1 hypothetical protein [Flavobacterium ichthyis]